MSLEGKCPAVSTGMKRVSRFFAASRPCVDSQEQNAKSPKGKEDNPFSKGDRFNHTRLVCGGAEEFEPDVWRRRPTWVKILFPFMPLCSTIGSRTNSTKARSRGFGLPRKAGRLTSFVGVGIGIGIDFAIGSELTPIEMRDA